jgi:hypothetical protein
MIGGAEDLTTAGVRSRRRRQVGTYRAHILNKTGGVARPSLVFEAPDDVTAIARARALAGDDAYIEVWEGNRRIEIR